MARKKKDTLNIYELLEVLNKKINTNTYNIKLNDKKLKTQKEEVKTYLLKEINNKIESTEKTFFTELDDYKEKTTKSLNKSQKTVISDSFKKLKIDINNDLEDLTDRIMNSRIL